MTYSQSWDTFITLRLMHFRYPYAVPKYLEHIVRSQVCVSGLPNA